MRIKSIILFLLVFFSLQAQKSLSLDEALNIALKNNYDIRVARNNSDIDKINNTPGNAGMLPTIQITGSGNLSQNNVYQKLSSGVENNFPSQSSSALNAGTELNWTLFDGGKMFVTKSKLSEIESLGAIQFKDKVLQTQFDIIAAYYDVVRQKQQLNSINVIINYNRERVKLTQIGFDAGYYLKSDLLQAKIDLNVSLENAVNQQFAINVAKKNLNVLLAQNFDTDFVVADSIPLDYTPDKEKLMSQLNSSNTGILMSQKQIDIAALVLKENKTGYLPKVNFRAGYYYSQSSNSVGTTLENRTFGPEVGGSVSIPLFSAGENKRKVSGAKLDLESEEYNLSNVKLQTKTELENALTDFENQQQLLKIEKENYELTKENLEISMQRLSHGQTTALEVHQAQEFYVQSFTRLINFEYNLKMSESKLKQLIASF